MGVLLLIAVEAFCTCDFSVIIGDDFLFGDNTSYIDQEKHEIRFDLSNDWM